MYDKLVIKDNAMNTKTPSISGLVTKIQYDSGKQGRAKKTEDVEKKIINTTGLVKKTDCNTNITEIKSKIPNVTVLVTTAAPNTKVTEIEKMSGITNLPTKTALITTVAEVE